MDYPVFSYESRAYQRCLDRAYRQAGEDYESQVCAMRFEMAEHLVANTAPRALPEITLAAAYADRFAAVLGDFYTAAMVELRTACLPQSFTDSVARDVGRRLVSRESSERLQVIQASWIADRPLSILDAIKRNFGHIPVTAGSPAAVLAEKYGIERRHPYAAYGAAVGRHFAEGYLSHRPAHAAATQHLLELTARVHLCEQLEYEQYIIQTEPLSVAV